MQVPLACLVVETNNDYYHEVERTAETPWSENEYYEGGIHMNSSPRSNKSTTELLYFGIEKDTYEVVGTIITQDPMDGSVYDEIENDISNVYDNIHIDTNKDTTSMNEKPLCSSAASDEYATVNKKLQRIKWIKENLLEWIKRADNVIYFKLNGASTLYNVIYFKLNGASTL